MARALDYSFGRPSAAAVKAAGYDAVIRYIGFAPTVRRKCITKSEYEDMVANDVAVAVVYEDDTGTVLQGRTRGQADAVAVEHWLAAIGAGALPCYFAVDFDAQPLAFHAMDEYFSGAADVLGVHRVGGYGSASVVGHLLDAGLITYAWQTVAWSHGVLEPRAHLYQRLGAVPVDGVTCDVNDILRPDFGQAATVSEDDVTPEQDVLLRDIHEQLCGAGTRAPGPYSGWETLEGTGRHMTVVDLLREAHRETTMRLPSRVAGNTGTDTVLGFAANADAFGNRLVRDVAALDVKLDAMQATVTADEVKLLAALKGLTVGAVDVHVLVEALAPLLPKSVTADEITAAFAAKLGGLK